MRRTLSAIGALAVIGTIAVPALAGNGGASAQIDICHATSSAKNPYVLIHPASPAVAHAHVKHHDGGDVVPPFEYKGKWYSSNWDADGQALLDGGCVGLPPGGGGGGGEF